MVFEKDELALGKLLVWEEDLSEEVSSLLCRQLDHLAALVCGYAVEAELDFFVGSACGDRFVEVDVY